MVFFHYLQGSNDGKIKYNRKQKGSKKSTYNSDHTFIAQLFLKSLDFFILLIIMISVILLILREIHTGCYACTVFLVCVFFPNYSQL